MSERVEKRLAALLDHPHFDPYGNPIPGLGEIGEESTRVGFLDGVASLLTLLDDGRLADGRATVARIAEPLQVDVELLTRLAEAGVSAERGGHRRALDRHRDGRRTGCGDGPRPARRRRTAHLRHDALTHARTPATLRSRGLPSQEPPTYPRSSGGSPGVSGS